MTLWADCAEKSPKKARPQTDLGVALHQRGKISEAMNRYYEALRNDPNYIDAHNNLRIILRRQGNLEEAMEHFSAVLRNDPVAGKHTIIWPTPCQAFAGLMRP